MSDTTTRASELKSKVTRSSEERDWDQFHNAKDLAIGIATEASELLETFRFKTEKEVEDALGRERSAKAVKDELADVLWFTLMLAQRYDTDLTKALEDKIRGNTKRHPVEKSKGSNKKHDEA